MFEVFEVVASFKETKYLDQCLLSDKINLPIGTTKISEAIMI